MALLVGPQFCSIVQRFVQFCVLWPNTCKMTFPFGSSVICAYFHLPSNSILTCYMLILVSTRAWDTKYSHLLSCALRWSVQPWRCAHGVQGNWKWAQWWKKPPNSGAGDPGGLPALHGSHPTRLPLLSSAHYPSPIWEDHWCKLSIWHPRYSSVCNVMLSIITKTHTDKCVFDLLRCLCITAFVRDLNASASKFGINYTLITNDLV